MLLRRLSVVAVAAVLAAPVLVVVTSVLTPSTDTWRRLWQTRLPEQLFTTVVLTTSVALGTLVIGTGLAWLVAAYRFPGRRVLGLLLMLPLALPGYVLAFVLLDTFSYAGPLQSTLRDRFGPEVWFPDVRSTWAAALVLTATLYPYVYLLARGAFAEQSATAMHAARTLGLGPVRAFLRVAVPMARPALAAGTALVVMETLTDIGTVRTFGVSTVADAVLRTWYGRNDLAAATELASLLVLAAVLVALGERRLRHRARYASTGERREPPPATVLRGARAWAATATCGAVVLFAFVLPVWRLAGWARVATERGVTRSVSGTLGDHVRHSLVLAVAAMVVCLVLGAFLASGTRLDGSWISRAATRVATTGYAVPGAVIGIGVLALLTAIDRTEALPGGVLVAGSVAGVTYGLVARFLAVGQHALDAGLERVTPTMEASARSLGARPRQVAWRVHVPLLRGTAMVAGALLLLDVVKELPATLLLRPTGFDTLPVWIWNLTSESQWQEAAVPALTLVVLALVPVGFLARALDRGATVTA